MMIESAGPHQLRRLLDAVIAVASELSLPVVLDRIVQLATELVGARYGALGVLDETHSRLVQFVTTGIDDGERRSIGHLPRGEGILGTLIRDPRPLRLTDLHAHPDAVGFPKGHPTMTSFLGVPIRIHDETFGNLYLCDKQAGGGFTEIDEELTVALAAAAAIAIENARLHERVSDVAQLEERERIARELHDTVMQRLFASGLTLQSAVRLTQQPEVAERLHRAIDDLDVTVREIRSVIFELHANRAPGLTLTQTILDLCSEARRVLGFEPAVHIAGPVDQLVGTDIGDHLLAVLREALTNVARHATADSVTVDVDARDGGLMLTVEDDGVGPDPASRGGRGLSNMGARASALGGEVAMGARRPRGTRLRWSVPLGS
jgi:signal transduction histidine kinase